MSETTESMRIELQRIEFTTIKEDQHVIYCFLSPILVFAWFQYKKNPLEMTKIPLKEDIRIADGVSLSLLSPKLPLSLSLKTQELIVTTMAAPSEVEALTRAFSGSLL